MRIYKTLLIIILATLVGLTRDNVKAPIHFFDSEEKGIPQVESAEQLEHDTVETSSALPSDQARPDVQQPPVDPTPPTNKAKWELIWKEEFDENKLDEVHWNAVQREENYNKELQAYHSENVSIQKGQLALTAQTSQGKYTSGMVSTEGKIDFLNGKLEFFAKYPSGKGLFPAIWLLPVKPRASVSQVPLPEIDILENIGSEPQLVYGVLHWRDASGIQRHVFGSYTFENQSDYHLYSLEWENNSLRWYVDNRLILQTSKGIPNTPMYLIMNLAVGGNWPGTPNQKTNFPATFYIDYVKYYTKTKEP